MTGGFAGVVADFVAEKRAVGYDYGKAERQLREVVRIHEGLGCQPGSMPEDVVLAYIAPRPNEKESTRLIRMSLVRGLATYMVRRGFEAYILPYRIGSVGREAYRPHIFSDNELAGIFAAADSRAAKAPGTLAPQHAIVLRLLYSTGMRVGEACALDKKDVDLDAGTVLIRQAKYGKERRVPLHPNMAALLGRHVSEASKAPFWRSHERFWDVPYGRQMSASWVYGSFRKCLWDAGISHGGRGRGPRVHDLRFTFACHTLRKWVREGCDVDAMLPYLATYMGHADTHCTEYYLKLTAELYPDVVVKAEGVCAWMIPEGRES